MHKVTPVGRKHKLPRADQTNVDVYTKMKKRRMEDSDLTPLGRLIALKICSVKRLQCERRSRKKTAEKTREKNRIIFKEEATKKAEAEGRNFEEVLEELANPPGKFKIKRELGEDGILMGLPPIDAIVEVCNDTIKHLDEELLLQREEKGLPVKQSLEKHTVRMLANVLCGGLWVLPLPENVEALCECLYNPVTREMETPDGIVLPLSPHYGRLHHDFPKYVDYIMKKFFSSTTSKVKLITDATFSDGRKPLRNKLTPFLRGSWMFFKRDMVESHKISARYLTDSFWEDLLAKDEEYLNSLLSKEILPVGEILPKE